jgi:nitrous oxide reductase accessory protein NosL
MFVSKYPEWLATVIFRDGHRDHFDGAKDMFKYLGNLERYAPGHRYEDISAMGVTEYYGLTMIDARQARFVIGSDVTGPMGHELVPLASQTDAEEFIQDHQGRRILTFDQVNRELLQQLDDGEFGE